MQRNDKDRRNKANPDRGLDKEKPINGCKRTTRKKSRRNKNKAIVASLTEDV